MAEFNEFYQRAEWYDIALGRDVGPEVRFIQDLARQRLGRPLGSALEIACGPGYHARGLAAAGAAVWAFDLRPEMIDLARERAENDPVPVHWFAADMRGFSLPQPVEAAIAVFDAIDCLLTNDEIVDHFRRVGDALTPDGFYLVDMTHPRDSRPYDYGSFLYSGERGGTKVSVRWAVNEPRVDPLTNVARVETEIVAEQDGRVLATIRNKAQERFASATEYAALAALSGRLKLAAAYGGFSLSQPFDNTPASRRMLLVFARS